MSAFVSTHTASRDRYLRHMHTLQADDAPLGNRQIALSLGVSAPSVSAMVDRLVDDGLVERAGKRGLRLSPHGRRAALLAIRRQRLLETFLADVLGLGWEEVCDEADRLEHVISDRLVERIDVVLGYPTRDPHGDPIPTDDGRYEPCTGEPLAEAPVGCRFLIERVSEHDAEALSHLASVGMTPGSQVILQRRAPFEGSIHVRANASLIVLSLALAANVFGRAVSTEPALSLTPAAQSTDGCT